MARLHDILPSEAGGIDKPNLQHFGMFQRPVSADMSVGTGILRRDVCDAATLNNGPSGAGLANRNLNKGPCRKFHQINSLFLDI